jgi:hypothetical protein
MTPGRSPLRLACLCLVVAAFVCARPASAADTDRVLLANGDRLSGEVKRLERGRLELSTVSLSTIYVEWDKVVSITTAGRLEVETSDGARYVGTLGTAGPKQLMVVGSSASIPLDLWSVVRMVPLRQTFLGRLSGSFDMGFSYAKSTGVATLSVNGDATYRRDEGEGTLRLSENFTRQPDVPESNRTSLKLGYAYYLPDRWVALWQGIAEQNRDLGFELRATGTAGIGRHLKRTNRSTFDAMGGVAIGREKPLDGPTVTNVEGLLGVNGSFFTYDYPKTDVTFQLATYPSFSEWGRVRIDFDTRFKRELYHDLYLAFTVYDAYDSRPPTEGADRNDIGVTLSLGWSFGK